jgi:Ca-activated chloride channel homolog
MNYYDVQRQAEIKSNTDYLPVSESSKFHIKVTDLYGEVTMGQAFSNQSGKNMEISYTFPLPTDAVLTQLKLMIGDQELVGKVFQKKSAEEQYENAVGDIVKSCVLAQS